MKHTYLLEMRNTTQDAELDLAAYLVITDEEIDRILAAHARHQRWKELEPSFRSACYDFQLDVELYLLNGYIVDDSYRTNGWMRTEERPGDWDASERYAIEDASIHIASHLLYLELHDDNQDMFESSAPFLIEELTRARKETR